MTCTVVVHQYQTCLLNYKPNTTQKYMTKMNILTVLGTFGFAPASNKHLIASVKPFSAASAKGLSQLAPPYRMQV
jgi:hypothetical protein